MLLSLLPQTLLLGRRNARRALAHRACAPYVDLELEVGGAEETIRLRCAEDASRIAAELAAKNGYDAADEAELAAILTLRWQEIYAGPSAVLTGVIASVELPAVGLALTVADSTVPDAGKGLFINCLEGVDSVALEAGTAVCGYADGSLRDVSDDAGAKTVAFALRDPETSVFFDKELWTVAELLEREDSGVDAIAGHTLEDGVLSLDGQYRKRYFVPDAVQQEPRSVMNIGCMANDLAEVDADDGLGDGADYAERSGARNALVLVQRLERDADNPFVLNPSRPVSTLRSRTVFCNRAPMELGCEYGERFWMAHSDEF